jgi:hypothetical protein
MTATTRRAALAFVLALSGCARSLPPPPPAPNLGDPADAIPPDLDAVVRVDVLRLKSTLGPLVLAALGKVANAGGEGASAFVLSALEQSDVVWFAFRPELAAGGVDNVVVLRGSFAGLDPRSPPAEPPFGSPRDLGGDVRRYERPLPRERGAPALVYAHGDELLVIASAAEIDSVDRLIDAGPGESVRPPSRGLFAFALRLRSLRLPLARSFPRLAELLEDTRTIEGVVDLASSELTLEVSLPFGDEQSAKGAADVFRDLGKAFAERGDSFGELAGRASVDAVGKFLVLRARLALSEVLRMAPDLSAATGPHP